MHQDVASDFLPGVIQQLAKMGVEIRGCERTREIVSSVKAAEDTDWGTEFLDMILAVKVVDSLDDAMGHIKQYGSLHSEAIISQDYAAIARFSQMVDAASILVNASTRFTDGGEFGYGAEMGISTQKLHARGPMGLKELTTTKYIVYGEGQIRA